MSRFFRSLFTSRLKPRASRLRRLDISLALDARRRGAFIFTRTALRGFRNNDQRVWSTRT